MILLFPLPHWLSESRHPQSLQPAPQSLLEPNWWEGSWVGTCLSAPQGGSSGQCVCRWMIQVGSRML